jgi:Histone RNA hairpin-binding protein RNA-binding domain
MGQDKTRQKPKTRRHFFLLVPPFESIMAPTPPRMTKEGQDADFAMSCTPPASPAKMMTTTTATISVDVVVVASSSSPLSCDDEQVVEQEAKKKTKKLPVLVEQAKRPRVTPSTTSGTGGSNKDTKRYKPQSHLLVHDEKKDKRSSTSSTTTTATPLLLDPVVHAHRIASREKAIDKGKNTAGYAHYVELVPKECRRPRSMETPMTPNPQWDIPAKRWQGLVRAWYVCLLFAAWLAYQKTCHQSLTHSLTAALLFVRSQYDRPYSDYT